MKPHTITVSEHVLHDSEQGKVHNVWIVMLTWIEADTPQADYEILTDKPDQEEIGAAATRLRAVNGISA